MLRNRFPKVPTISVFLSNKRTRNHDAYYYLTVGTWMFLLHTKIEMPDALAGQRRSETGTAAEESSISISSTRFRLPGR